MITRRMWPTALGLSAAAALLLVGLNIESPLRTALALWLILVCPGMALVRLLGVTDGVMEWTLAVATSLTLAALIAIAMAYSGLWAPSLGVAILAAIAVAGAAAELLRGKPSARPQP